MRRKVCAHNYRVVIVRSPRMRSAIVPMIAGCLRCLHKGPSEVRTHFLHSPRKFFGAAASMYRQSRSHRAREREAGISASAFQWSGMFCDGAAIQARRAVSMVAWWWDKFDIDGSAMIRHWV